MKIVSFEELKNNANKLIATSPWFLIEQSLINDFAKVTGDEQWIHIDTDRAKNESLYKSTIAHGYLLVSLIPNLVQQSYCIEGVKTKINYGLNKVRFLQPVKPNQRIRANFFVEQCEALDKGYCKVELRVEIEIESIKEIACVAHTVVLCLP